MRFLLIIVFLLIFCGVPSLAKGTELGGLLTGTQAFGDWTSDAPGTRRLIKASDLPPPHATPSAVQMANLVPRPDNAQPRVPAGFRVSAFFTGLTNPRQMRVAPNGDVFVAESEAKRIRVLRGSPKAHTSSIFASGLRHRPYGIAFYPPGSAPEYVYVATEGEVVRYPYRNGDLRARAHAETIVPSLPVGHHWTRDIVFDAKGSTLFVSVGSGTNDAEKGIEFEKNRADILAFNPDGTNMRIFASGLRNPVSIIVHPATGEIWATVNERDELGDDVPPDYATHVTEGGFYGWPWYYIGGNQDPRYAGAHPELRNKVIVPDVLFEAHSAALGLALYEADQFPSGYQGNIFVAFHGSWNRERRTGYKVVRVPLDGGRATGEYIDFMTGFVTRDGKVWGRPVGVAVAADGALLVSDDGSGTIWRVECAGR